MAARGGTVRLSSGTRPSNVWTSPTFPTLPPPACAGVVAFADPGEHVAAGVVGHDPFKTGLIAIHLVQRRQRAIEPVEISDQRLDACVFFLFEQMPVKRAIVIPFALLAELAAHEHQLFAGMSEHEGVISAQIGEALPV